MTTIDKAAVVWTITIVAIGIIFASYSSIPSCPSDQIKDDKGKCGPKFDSMQEQCNPDQIMDDNGICVDKSTIEETLTMEDVINMRILRIDSLLNYLSSPSILYDDQDSAKELVPKELGEIKSDIKNNYSLSAYNKMYQFREHFDGAGNDELVSDTPTRKDIYNLISDILLSQEKTLFLPTNNNP
jgi:hypothetical protein